MGKTYICLESVIAYLQFHKDKMRREKAVLSADEDEIIRFLKTVPPEDVAPVKRGRWKHKEDPYGFFETIPVCSACGCTNKFREEYLYCPMCGARMGE